jgi:ubiquinone/menaquinone biosynthesis C-methylase UbiE
MRKALNMQKLKGVYDQVAKRYDLQHSILTARSNQRDHCHRQTGGSVPAMHGQWRP